MSFLTANYIRMIKTIKPRFTISLLLTSIFLFFTSVSPNNYHGEPYVSFYKGEEGVLYFIKPLKMKSKDSKLLIDFTFNYNYIEGIDSSEVIFNFSIIKNKPVKNINKITFSNTVIKVESKNTKLIFIDNNKRKFISRHSSTLSLTELRQIFKDINFTIKVEENQSDYSFSTTNKTQRKVKQLNKTLFKIFE